MHTSKRFRTFLALSFVALGSSLAPAQLTIQPITWNIVGLKHNDVTTGPNRFPLGVRIRNNSTTSPARNVLVNVNLATATNSYINVEAPSSDVIATLAPGASQDVYFSIVVTRNAAAYGTSRGYTVTAVSDEFAQVSTPLNRELFVEGLQAQSRNSIASFTGPTETFIGYEYDYLLNASTATQGYEQLTAWSLFPVGPFRVISTNFTASAPSNYRSNVLYQDACSWDPNIGQTRPKGTYLSCLSTGKTGGTITLTTRVRPVAAGNYTIDNLIYDYSGSSFHYNSEFGSPIAVLPIRVYNPATFGDLVWSDNNFNGVYDAGVDTGISGVRLNVRSAGTDGLFNTADDVVETAVTTGANGTYTKTPLKPGSYRVSVDLATVPGGYAPTAGQLLTKTVTLAEGQTSLEQDFGFINEPLLANVDYLAATLLGPGEAVQIAWRTSAEFDNAGFNVYRAVSDRGVIRPGQKINSSLIPAQGTETEGAAYEFYDYTEATRDVEIAAPYWGYFIEDVDIMGAATLHGPAPVQFGEEYRKAVSTSVMDWTKYE